MKVNKAIQRIQWRMNEGGWKSNENDIEAINSIIDHINESSRSLVNQNDLFARLFVEVMRRTVKVQGVKFTDKNATRWILEAMEIPFHQHVTLLTKELNDQSFFEKMEKNGVEMKHPALKTDVQKKQEVDTLYKNYVEVLKNEWDEKTVEYFLVSSITHIINKFND
jgi:hypothetical protein